MSHSPGKKCSCGACSSLYSVRITVPADGEDGTVHQMKLLEQTHCARCWRPLLTATAYPGARWVAIQSSFENLSEISPQNLPENLPKSTEWGSRIQNRKERETKLQPGK